MSIKYKSAASRGFTLVELMVSILLSSIILAAVVQSLLSVKGSYLLQEELARMQENSRFALDILADEIRMAGYTGCSPGVRVENALNNTEDWNRGYPGVLGFEGEGSLPKSFTAPAINQDSIVIRRGNSDSVYKVWRYQPELARIDIMGQQKFPAGSVMMMADGRCESIAIFQVADSGPGGRGYVIHEPKINDQPDSCRRSISSGGGCSKKNSHFNRDNTFASDSRLMAMSTTAFYISKNIAGVPALYRKPVRVNRSKKMVADKQELVEGVEGMQLSYGVDIDFDGRIDSYRKADHVGNWDSVISVHIELLIRSLVSVGASDITVTFNDHDYNDGYIRQLFSSTVMLRNR